MKSKIKSSYQKNVFINCPFDDQYFELRNIILFTVVWFGYEPRIALELSDSGESRLQKIVRLIRESKFAIHDLSRLQSAEAGEYYRLNMPFELGIDYGVRIASNKYKDKRSLILETKQYDYMKALSDINGFDIKHHSDDPETLISCIRSWFAETVGKRKLDSSSKLYIDFIGFNTHLFIDRVNKYQSKGHNETASEKLAKAEIAELTVPEFIDEVRIFRA